MSNKLFHLIPDKNIILIWKPRAGCSIVNMMYYEELNILKKIHKLYNQLPKKPLSIPVHWYYSIHKKNMAEKERNIFNNKNIKYVQFTVNPYQRAVSSYIFFCKYGHGYSKNLKKNINFEEFLFNILNNKIGNSAHHTSQIFYLDKDIKYYKLEYFKDNIDDFNKDYNLNFRIPTYKTGHETKKKIYLSRIFVGNTKYSDIKDNIPNDYSNFYNDKIRKLVEKIYGEDISKLNYNWDEFISYQRRKK